MKIITRLLQVTLCFTLLILVSCKNKPVQGDGDVISKEIPVDIYNEIRVEGAMDIIYEAKPDEAAYLRVEADDNIIPLLDIETKKNKLTIKVRESINPSRFLIYTNSPSLKYVENKGASNIHLTGAIAGDEFKLDQRGIGDFKADNLVFTKAEFYLRGSGNMTLGGDVSNSKMEISGNGDIKAENFKVKELNCSIKGNGDITVDVTDKLSVEIKGNGEVTYLGSPQITKQKINGSGVVKAKG